MVRSHGSQSVLVIVAFIIVKLVVLVLVEVVVKLITGQAPVPETPASSGRDVALLEAYGLLARSSNCGGTLAAAAIR